MYKFYRFIILALLTCVSMYSHARHILGGNFELNNTGSNGYYELKLNLFFDKATRAIDPVGDNNFTVAIYRKSDNVRMRSLVLSSFEINGTPLVYTNEKCAAAQGLNISVISYGQNIYLDPATYDNPQGYYIVWDRCCRNSADNIINSQGAGMLFYLEFPPLLKSGGEFKNSSPQFTAPNGEYICVGQPFKFDNGATDADGDQLRYSLVTPYNGFSNSNVPAPAPRASSSYPTINWITGFDANTAIPSNPAMKIDVDGIITVKSDQLGLFVFSVEVEELRGGVVIGRVRRDFQLKVISCQVPPPKPIVYKALEPLPTQLATIDVCENGFVEIATKNDPNFQYQWQKDNSNLADGGDNYNLKVTEAGEYTVVISYKQGCSGSSISGKTIVSVKPGEKFKISPDKLEVCETPAGIVLQVQKEDGSNFNASAYKYLWTRNRTDTLLIKNVFIQARQTGMYNARMTQIAGSCLYDVTADLIVNPLPEAKIFNPSGKKVVCEGDSIPIRANANSTFIYDWQRNGVSVQNDAEYRFDALKTGIYRFEVVDEKGCRKTSDTLKLTFNPLTPVKFDTIFPTCGTGNNRINLSPYVNPYDGVKGIFTGRGVSGITYSPLLAGFGASPIVYTYTNDFGCVTKASRIAFVDLTPKVRLGDDIIMFRGDTITIKSSISGSYNKDLIIKWSPAEGLNNTSTPRPVASPIVSTRYILSATALSSNCANQDTIEIFVKTKINIPTGFTPNDDNVNEKWILEGIEDYPEAEIKIFNRWGGEIFVTKNYQNNPFDGRKDGSNLPTGTYYYVIKTGDTIPIMTGYVTIVR